MSETLIFEEQFEHRHHGSSSLDTDTQAMLDAIGVDSVEELITQTLPASIRLTKPMNLPAARSEAVFLKEFADLAAQNQVFKSYIGMGYYGTFTPNVILRNVLENPCWYTAYTPYQAEIAQGRLEALINFQTMIMDLTGMQIANASLLDEATAAAEAMAMLFSQRKDVKKSANVLLVSAKTHPQTIDVLYTRAEPIGIVIELTDLNNIDLSLRGDIFALLYQYPDTEGSVQDFAHLVSQAIAHNIFTIAATDLLSLCLLVPPGQIGVDVVVGTSQRFGVPMGFGGPHAAFFATKDVFKRNLPGRLIGVSVDAQGNRAYRMALQTREQHIRREKATSNICTAQVLLAVMASCYAVYHGPKNLYSIANRVGSLAETLAQGIRALDLKLESEHFFDTLKINNPLADMLRPIAELAGINFRYFEDQTIGIALDETTTLAQVNQILALLARAAGKNVLTTNYTPHKLPDNLLRKDTFLAHPVFNSHHTEHAMLRYLKKLESKDLSLAHSMIALGSCTMKLNATAEMIPISWPCFANMHPFVPKNQAKGYYKMFDDLQKWLAEITGFAAVTLQPNSGAQGEYAGLMVIRAYHQNNNNHQRNIALIPASAHGTNPASAVMAGMKVVVVNCDSEGNIDQSDLQSKALAHKDNLACLMVTYPSTHGVFEDGIREICELIHEYGGQVYMDGANMNAQVGLSSPGYIGADVCHLNLHKTFCIPHGGGGPGMGPIGVGAHLAPFLPSHSVVAQTGGNKAIRALSAAPFGSAGILPISYAYIAMMGPDGLMRATQKAILNANYIKTQLEGVYPILYAGANGRCAHELIIDFRGFKRTASIEVQDVAKRLMDYGFHAPTVSFPVAGTLMIEPTESETKAEIDRFCQALLAIRNEISEIESGVADIENNVLRNAPHTARLALSDDWALPYSRQKAVYPLDWVMENKFWPSVARIDSAYGDRNLMCACPAIETYSESMVSE